MPLNQACLNRTYGPSHYALTTEKVSDFAAATLSAPLPTTAEREDVALPTMAFIPCWPVIQEAIADPDLGNAPGQIIHGEQVMRFHRPLRAGDTLTTTGTVTRIEPKGRNEVYVLHLESRDGSGALVVEQDNICISLGSAAEATAPTNGAPASAKQSTPPTPPVEPPRQTWVSQETLPADITREYSQASGDFSEVHLDDEFAQKLGFPGIIVHGMCLLSVAIRPILAKLDDNVGRVQGLRVRFASPVRPGETIRTEYVQEAAGYAFTTYVGDRKALGAGLVEVAES
jgi:acyl dehydratase